jgi:hypothetical protein
MTRGKLRSEMVDQGMGCTEHGVTQGSRENDGNCTEGL